MIADPTTSQYSSQSAAKIYLLMGRFGSGKTTLLRRILANSQTKCAVIQNEFAEGEMGIEQPLIMDETGTPFSSFLQLPNGCICCSAKNDLVAAVEYIVANTGVRSIVVETNGLADPAASIRQFWFDEQMSINAELHSVITMVNARRWQEIQKDPLFLRQCAFANKLLVSFLDVAGEDKYGDITEALQDINSEALIRRSNQVDLDELLQGCTLFSKETLSTLHLEHHTEHLHHHSIRPLFLKGKCSLQKKEEVEQRIGELLWQRGLAILRIKGVICLPEHPYVLELQGVEDIFEVKETKTSVQVYAGETRLLVIGENLQGCLFKTLLQIE